MADTPATSTTVSQSLADRLQKFLNDVTTLDVVTLTGNISITSKLAPQTGSDDLNWEELLKQITTGKGGAAAADLQVLAYTHAELDCDSINYVKKNLSESEQVLLANHTKTVEAAQRSRFEALQFIGKALGSLKN